MRLPGVSRHELSLPRDAEWSKSRLGRVGALFQIVYNFVKIHMTRVATAHVGVKMVESQLNDRCAIDKSLIHDAIDG